MSEFEEVMAEAAPNLLKLEISKHPDVDTYCHRLIGRYRGSELLDFMAEVAQVIEPVDRVLGCDPDFPCANAFITGSAMAMRVVREFAPRDIQRKMLGVTVATDTIDQDQMHRVYSVANSAVETGEQGIRLVPALEPLVDEWAEQAIPDIRYQPYFRRGFGLVMYMMHGAYESAAWEQLATAERDGVDWDKEIEALFGSEE